MWYTTRYEGFDGVKQTGRAPGITPALQGCLSGLMRAGFLLKLCGLFGCVLDYYVYRGSGFFTYDLQDTTEEQRAMLCFRLGLMFFAGLQILGALHLMGFQTLLADDASWARGYRAGSKMLSVATFLDTLGSAFQFLIYAYMYLHYDNTWWSMFQSGGVEWLIYALARLLIAFSSFYYASALFLLESYHDNGTNDWHGLLNAFLFTSAGAVEIYGLVCERDTVSVWISCVANLSALVWAMAFEQEVIATSPLLTEAELTNEIESQVEKFAREHPYAPAEIPIQ